MTLEQLSEIKNKMNGKVGLRPADAKSIRVTVGMATCGNAAGARPVYETLAAAAAQLGDGVEIVPVGCIGICQFEPVVEVMVPGQEKVTYVKMNAEKTAKVIEQHIKGGEIVTEYTIGA